jgi:UPF0755 protein
VSSSSRPVAPRRARPVFEGPTYMAPRYHSRLWGRLIFLVFILLLVGLIGGGGGLYWALHRAQGSASQVVVFRVGSGDTVNTVATRLEKSGIIDNSLLFKLDARIHSLSAKLKPGAYTLRRNMSIDQMVGALAIYKPVYVAIAIPPGYRARQIAAVLQEHGINGQQFLQEVDHPDPKFLNSSILGDKPPNATLEGYLFPDTYDVLPHSSGKDFVKLMVHQMSDEVTPAMRAAIAREHRTIYQTLILASIVEREAGTDSDRPKIASVYLNRLSQKPPWRLDADPTVQYALASDLHAAGKQGPWWPVLTDKAANIEQSSPYNTYTHAGLPPSPIANPQLASIRAVVYPAHTNFMFFLHKPHSHGQSVFAVTLAEQTANQQKYGTG